jgi:hypothetical protein
MSSAEEHEAWSSFFQHWQDDARSIPDPPSMRLARSKLWEKCSSLILDTWDQLDEVIKRDTTGFITPKLERSYRIPHLYEALRAATWEGTTQIAAELFMPGRNGQPAVAHCDNMTRFNYLGVSFVINFQLYEC